MSIEIKYFENRKDWRKWLNDNFETANEVWFVFPSKSSGEKSITYNDAVEEALCFEWIDSTIKSLDKEHKIQHFTPRNPKSTYSQANKERLKWLLENKMIHPKFEDKIRNVLSDPFIFPNDIIERFNNLDKEVDRKKTEQSFFVDVNEIRENGYDLSINKYKEIVYEEVVYDAPVVIMNRVKELEKEISVGLEELERMLEV